MISTEVRWNQSQQVSTEMIKHHSNREQALVEQALRPVLNLIFYHFNCSERLLKSHHVFSYL